MIHIGNFILLIFILVKLSAILEVLS